MAGYFSTQQYAGITDKLEVKLLRECCREIGITSLIYNNMKKIEDILSSKSSDFEDLKRRYLNVLEKTYEKGGQNKCFKTQFDNGQGKELDSKFWSPISSSRLAFELYSWIANSNQCKDIEFEFRLPGIISGNREASAYMDVYIKTEKEIRFIESKFTEEAGCLGSSLPQAYYKQLTSTGEEDAASDFNEDTYYKTAAGKLAKKPMSVKNRFRGQENVAKYFIPFVNHMMRIENSYEHDKWFDAKQETCHLFGIIMYIIENVNNLVNEGIDKVHLQNIYFCKYPEDSIRSSFTATFISEAEKMVGNILEEYNIKNIRFEFGTSTVQDVLKKYGKEQSYVNVEKTVEESILENFPGIDGFL